MIVYEQHFFYFNISKSGVDVNFINFVRDPVERIISNFFYQRTPYRWLGGKIDEKPNKEWFNKNIDTCVLKQDPECMVWYIAHMHNAFKDIFNNV